MRNKPPLRQKPKANPELLKAISEFTNANGTPKSPEQWLAEQKERVEARKNRPLWENLTAAQKYAARIHWAAVIIPAFVAVVTILLTINNANKQIDLSKQSVAAVLKQDSTNQRNLKLMQKEFELNYRPYMAITYTNVLHRNNQVVIQLSIKNLGKIPGVCKVMHVTRYKNRPDDGPVIKEVSGIILFPDQENKLELQFSKKDIEQMVFYKVYLDYKSKSDSGYLFSTFYNFEIDLADLSLILRNSQSN